MGTKTILRLFCQYDPNAVHARLAGRHHGGDYHWSIDRDTWSTTEDGEPLDVLASVTIAEGYEPSLEEGYEAAERAMGTLRIARGDHANGYELEEGRNAD